MRQKRRFAMASHVPRMQSSLSRSQACSGGYSQVRPRRSAHASSHPGHCFCAAARPRSSLQPCSCPSLSSATHSRRGSPGSDRSALRSVAASIHVARGRRVHRGVRQLRSIYDSQPPTMRLDATSRRARVSCVLAVGALVLSGCAHVAHTYGSILPAGTPFRVNLWGWSQSYLVRSVAVADDRVAVARPDILYGGPVPRSRLSRGRAFHHAPAPAERRRLETAAPGEGDLFRVECALGYGAPWRVTTVRHVVAPSAVGVAFDNKGPVTACWLHARACGSANQTLRQCSQCTGGSARLD